MIKFDDAPAETRWQEKYKPQRRRYRMKKFRAFARGWTMAIWLILALLIFGNGELLSQSLDIPSKKWGISFGNSKKFTGLRFNFRDSQVCRITGINITLWYPKKDDNNEAIVEGLSLGSIPMGGYLRGVQIGLLGISAAKSSTGISIGVLGVGSGEDMTGVNNGGLGAGAGQDMKGLNIGGLGVGAGRDLIGINIGGLGAGAGRDMTGLNLGLFGVGAGHRMVGINIGGLGAGAPNVYGLNIGGLGVGGETLKGVHLALGMVHVPNDGQMIGFAASAFNYIKGTQTGLAIGLVNYAYRLKGVQIGLVNIVRDNPKYRKVLPLINANF